MRRGRPKVALILTADERQRLESLAHRSRSAPAVARRARLIVACADGSDSKVVARRLHVTPATVSKWRGRFVRQRLDGLYDEPRPGAKRTITDDQVEAVIVRTLETTPRGATHWIRGKWRKPSGSVTRRLVAFGTRLGCSRIGPRHLNCRMIPCSSKITRHRRPLSGPTRARGGVLRR